MDILDTLENKLRQQLKDNPSLILPNADNVLVDERKYTHYLFGGSNEDGLIKGRLITKKLGYNISNYHEFDKKIKQAVKEFPAVFKTASEYGNLYEIVSVIHGLTGDKAKVVIGAIIITDISQVTSIYIKEVKITEV